MSKVQAFGGPTVVFSCAARGDSIPQINKAPRAMHGCLMGIFALILYAIDHASGWVKYRRVSRLNAAALTSRRKSGSAGRVFRIMAKVDELTSCDQ